MSQPHLIYKELLKLVSYGIFAMTFKGISVNDERLDKCDSITNAFYKGKYTGSPGRDIYFMLPYLSDDQMEEIVDIIVDKFPNIPPGNHVNIGAFIRFIYGQFEKKGILRSKEDFKRMKKKKIDWLLSEKFINLLHDKLKENNNYYGLSIICEMKAHRMGDQSVLNKDKEKIIKMEELYLISVKYAHKCKSYKQMFTPYYWSFRYFEKYKDKKKAKKYAFFTIEEASKYCPDARPGYVTKLKDCLKYIKEHDKKGWSDFVKKYKNSKNRCVRKSF